MQYQCSYHTVVTQQICAHYPTEYSGPIDCDQISINQLIDRLWLGNNQLWICCEVTALYNNIMM